jgi:hypothetical protein
MDSKIPTKKETDSRTEINKQQTKRIIMYFSCQEEEKKNTNNQLPMAIQQLSVYMRHIIWKRS